MIKQGLMNFFNNLKYFFTPLGALFLGVLFGVCFLFSGFKTQLNYATSEIKTITQEANINTEQFKDCIVNNFSDLPWDKPIEAVKKITSAEWIQAVKTDLENTIENYALYARDIEATISKAFSGFKKYIAAFAICSFLGLIGGFFLTKFLIRRNIARRNIWKFLLVTLADSILTAGIALFSLWLTLLWTPSIIFASMLGIVIYGFVSLFEAYLVHGYKKMPINKIINMKNIFELFASNMIIFLISLAFSWLIVLITNAFVGAFIALPLLIIGIIIISLNAESYVKGEAEKVESLPSEPTEISETQSQTK